LYYICLMEPLADNQMLEILNEQLKQFKNQMQVRDNNILALIEERTYLAMQIKVVEESIKLVNNPIPAIVASSSNKPQLTREFVREFMKYRKKWTFRPIQTKEIVNAFYKNATEEEKTKAIKILSVVLNNLEKSGEVSIERKKGIKGNFYSWNGEI
jgi:hypothetical protein